MPEQKITVFEYEFNFEQSRQGNFLFLFIIFDDGRFSNDNIIPENTHFLTFDFP